MNPRPLGPEPSALPSCAISREKIAKKLSIKIQRRISPFDWCLEDHLKHEVLLKPRYFEN